jgi:antitoxin component of MazEF toxin-antitoxin module
LFEFIYVKGIVMQAVLNAQAQIRPWGNSLGLRFNRAIVEAAKLFANADVSITANPGRIVIETRPVRPSLDEMLAKFDKKLHGGEVMSFTPIGREVM